MTTQIFWEGWHGFFFKSISFFFFLFLNKLINALRSYSSLLIFWKTAYVSIIIHWAHELRHFCFKIHSIFISNWICVFREKLLTSLCLSYSATLPNSLLHTSRLWKSLNFGYIFISLQKKEINDLVFLQHFTYFIRLLNYLKIPKLILNIDNSVNVICSWFFLCFSKFYSIPILHVVFK